MLNENVKKNLDRMSLAQKKTTQSITSADGKKPVQSFSQKQLYDPLQTSIIANNNVSSQANMSPNTAPVGPIAPQNTQTPVPTSPQITPSQIPTSTAPISGTQGLGTPEGAKIQQNPEYEQPFRPDANIQFGPPQDGTQLPANQIQMGPPQNGGPTVGDAQITAQLASETDLILNNAELLPDHPNFKELSKRKNELSVYGSLPPEDIAGLVESGELFPGSSAMSDLQKFNPELFAQSQLITQQNKKISDINTGSDVLYNSLTDGKKFSLATKPADKTNEVKAEPTKPVNDYISKELKSRFGENANDYFDVTAELMSAPNVQKWKDEVYDLSGKVNEYDQQIENLYEEAGRELGDEAPDYLRSAYVSTKAKDIRRLKDPLVKQLALAQNMLQVETKEQMTLLDQVTKGRQQDLKQAQLRHQQDFAQEKFDYAQEQDTLDRQFQQQKFQASQNKQSPVEQQSFQNTSQSVTTNSVSTRSARTSTVSNLYQDSGGGNEGFAMSVEQIPDGTNGGQCGAFVNDMLKGVGDGTHFGDSFEQKMSLTNNDTVQPGVGSAAVFSLPGKYEENGHVGMIIGEDENNYTIKESNFPGGEVVGTRTISKNDPSLAGFYTPTSLKQTEPEPVINTKENPSLDSLLSSSGTLTKSGLKKLGLEGKSSPEVLNKMGSTFLSEMKNDPVALTKKINGLTIVLSKTTDVNAGNKPVMSDILDSATDLYRSAGVDAEVAIKSWTELLKEQLTQIEESGGDDPLLKGSLYPINFSKLMKTYGLGADSKKDVIDIMKTVMSSSDFDSIVDEAGLDMLNEGYDQLFDLSLKTDNG